MKAPIRRVRSSLVIALLCSAGGLATACGSGTPSATSTTTIVVTPLPSASAPAGTGASSPAAPSSSPASSPAGPGECATASLRVSVGQSQGAAGTIYYNIDFTNVSGTTCFVQGYPGISLVSAGSNAGSQIGSDAKRNPLRPSKLITLASGQTANALLGIAEVGAFPASTCTPVTAHWMKVFPPDQFVATYVKFTTQTCASTSVHTMHVAAMAAGA
jgi:hypothetical protein